MLTVVTNHSGHAARRSLIELPFEHTQTGPNAMPKVNSDAVGWIVSVTHHPWKAHAAIGTEESRGQLPAIESRVCQALGEIATAPTLVERKSRRALLQIGEQHSPQRAAQSMEKLYGTVLANT